VRAVVLAVVAVACGRAHFQTSPDASADSAPDAPVGMACTADTDCGRCARCAGTCQVEPVNALFLGHRSLCYIGANGDRWCAGENYMGLLGLGDTVNRSTPERAQDGGGWDAIYMSYYSSSIGSRGGQFWDWGPNATMVPVASSPSRAVREALEDDSFQCFWEQDGTAMCEPSGSIWQSLAYGSDHTCGVKPDGTLWCYGTDYDGDLGQPSVSSGSAVAAPTQVGTSTMWVQVATGGELNRGSTCALDTNHQIWCWGTPALAGTNNAGAGTTPTLITNEIDWIWIKSSWEHSCAGKTDGRVYCWGDDNYGGFVAIGLTSAPVPTQIPGTYTQWVMGGHHACGLDSTGKWQCFGWNSAGQLGIGNTTNDGQLYSLCP
jgi:hypothetical protein